ncbi:MAG TPA: adenosylmethionine--8-amino-7-oxononanoate transaminase [Pyrinomonadaceae bacterium]|nr:adenosylmethionine--8-amino-7-oxononanoate transaminase [Pyrinomonadaceae bacterium]
MNLTERDRKVLWHPYTQEKTAPPPIGIARGRGVWLETEDGRRILDGTSSWWVNIHGHSHPFLNAALAKQADELQHTIFAGFTHKPAVELAEKLVALLPKGLSRIFYSDNGSTAVEVALKMAYQFWQNRGEERKTFVALPNAYHGDTFGAMAASGESAFTKPFASLLFNVLRAGSLEDIERIFRENSKEIAAVIVEPMLQGAGGMIIWEKEFLSGLRALCDKYDVLLIADEVLTGFGRTGEMFACEHADVSPDIICLSKALTAGYLPLGATAATKRIYEAFLSDDRLKTFFHGHSFTANPLACAVAVASLELFERENRLEKIAFINRKFTERLPKLIDLDCVKDVRIIGAVGVVELAADTDGYFANVGQNLYREFLKRDILLRPLGSVLYFMPPYVISEKELDWVLDEITNVLVGIDR